MGIGRKATATVAAAILVAACNALVSEQTATPIGAIIRGTVWRDLCDPDSGEGCVAQGADRYSGNGQRDANEPGIEGIYLDLGLGTCPSSGLDRAQTGSDGSYAFIGHAPGVYCVSVDTSEFETLGPGHWTQPADGPPSVTVAVLGGEDLAGLDFGRDPANLVQAEDPPENTLVTAAMVANCRAGPGTVYGTLTQLPEGASAHAEGRSQDGGWWWVSPSAGPEHCWVSNLTVNTNFDAAELPVVEAPPAPPGSIGGQVWHDVCDVERGDGSQAPIPSLGCLEQDDGGYLPNGVMEADEPRLPGVLINLGSGECPSQGAATTISGDRGEYLFEELSAGTYCVSVNAFGAVNSTILIPGQWSQPDGDNLAVITVVVGPAEQISSIDFGWNYQFLP